MRETVDIARAEYETSAQLEWVFPELLLAMAGGLGTRACPRVVTAKQVKDVRLTQLGGVIRLASVVDEEREGDAGLFTE